MTNPSLFFAIAGVSMSFAGFAGLYLALRPRDAAWLPHEIGQLNAIILFGLTALFGALSVVPLAVVLGVPTALQAMSAALLVVAVYIHEVKLGTAWPRWPAVRPGVGGRQLFIEMAPFVLVALVDQALLAACLFNPSEQLYQLALISLLGTPALVFVLVVNGFATRTPT